MRTETAKAVVRLMSFAQIICKKVLPKFVYDNNYRYIVLSVLGLPVY